jgi:outer membrane immunogenic protein
LFYGTGGVAFGGFRETHTVLGYGYPDNALSTRDETKAGWTVGAGVEWAIGGNWSAKAEYLFMSFPDVGGLMQWAPHYGPATDGFHGDWNVQTVRLGLNYRF